MTGDDRVRFCGQCRLNVYDLSQLSEEEAQALVARTGGSACVRLWRRRADGKVLTRDCPVGLAAIKRRVVSAGAAAVALVSAALGGVFGVRGRENPPTRPPLRAIDRPEIEVEMGRMAVR